MRILLLVLLCGLLPFDVFSSTADTSQRKRLVVSRELDIFEAKIKADKDSAPLYSNKNNNNKFHKRYNSFQRSKNSKLSSYPRAYLSAGGDLYYIHYREIQDGSTLDKDTGSVMGLYVKLSYLSSSYVDYFSGFPYLEAYFRYSNGKSKYSGATGAGTHVSFKEDLEIERFGLKIGARKYISDGRLIYGYFDVGKRVWIRGSNELIGAALNYKEKYRWLYLGLGTGVKRKIGDRIIAGIDAEFMYAPRSFRKMHAELYDGNTLILGSVWGVELKAPLRYTITKRFSFDIIPYYTFWHIGKSNTDILRIGGIPVAYIQEPRSQTYMYGVLFGLTISLI